MIAQTVIDPKADKNEPGHQADNQTTRYIYAAELNAAANAAGSPVPRADLLRAVLYPDSSLSAADVIAILNGDPGAPANYDFVEYVYHANGATAAMADQRGVNHDYLYDALGRLTEDRASPLGDPNVDGAVRAIVTTYNQRGLAAAVTSYNDPAARDAANVVNQVAYAYNGLNLVTQAWQSHAGPVNRPADAGPDSPSVHYAYDPLGRLTAVTYPNGRVVAYSYGTGGSMDDRLSRVAVIADGTGQNAPHLADYAYLGASTIVRETFPQPAVRLNYSDANGAVNRLDRFGRVLDQVWEHYDELGVTDAIRDFFAYGYDLAGNRTQRQNVLADAAGKDFSEVYAYDEVYRLIGTDRGRFASGSFVKANDFQDWSLDGLGNWSGFNDNGAEQERTVNAANEITAISGGSVSPSYDAAGNLRSAPQNGTETQRVFYTYDAWNRQTAVFADTDGDGVFEPGTGDALLAAYEYDGLNRRIAKTTTVAGGGAGRVEYFFNENWQVLEEQRFDGELALTATQQYVWSLRYIDAPILRDTLVEGQVVASARVFYLSDANHNVTALVDVSGAVTSRVVYEAYGAATVYSATWTNPAAPSTDGPLYCGYWLDTETGNYLARNRIYNTVLYVWAQRDPLGYAAGAPNLMRYCGNSPVNAVDPSGLEYVSQSGRTVYWNVQHDGWAWNTTIETIPIGTMQGGQVKLSPTFGGGTVSASQLRTFAEHFWRRYPDISAATPGAQVTIINGALDTIRHGGTIRESSTAMQMVGAAGSGAADGGAVATDTLSFGYLAHERSQRAQREALERGDVVSQIGFGAGKVGARATQALGIVVVGSWAGGYVASTAAGKAVLATTTAQGVILTTQVTLAVSGGVYAVESGKAAIDSAREGNYIAATEGFGNAGLSVLFAGSLARRGYNTARSLLTPRPGIGGLFEVPLGDGAAPGSSQFIVGNVGPQSQIGVTQVIAGQFPGPGVSPLAQASGACPAVSLVVVTPNGATAPGATETQAETLTRYAGGKESVTRLNRLAQESLENPLERVYGQSVTASPPDPTRASSQLPRSAVEKHFPVHDTPMPEDPLHRTAEMPNPITKEIADLWNKLWGFK